MATTKPVDKSLWWDSFIVLFNELENAPLSSELPLPLVNKLKSNHAWFLDSLSMFKPPNQASKLALEAEKVSIGSNRLVVRSELKDAALEVSSLLFLDEVQSYLILKRGIEQNSIPPDPKVHDFLHLVLLQYFLERQCLLKCIREILCRTLYVANETNASDGVQEEALQLISDGLERKLLSKLQDLVSCKHLEHVDFDIDTLWVEEALIEVNLVLDVLFVTYYETFCTCKFEQWKILCTLFKGILSDSLSIGNLAISIEARNSLYQLKVKLLLILIETLDLESLLGMVHDGVPFRNGNFVFSMANIQEMDSIVSSFNTSDAAEAGPLVLAWAVFLCLTASLPDKQEYSMLVEIDHISYVRQAFEAAPLRYFLEILDSNVLKDSDSPVTGYRSVMRTFISAFVASYEISHQLEDSTFNQILDVLCKIYHGEESLCVQFWDKESFVDSPIRSLLFSLEAEFPYRMVELVRILSALSEGAWPAECVYNFLDKMVGVASLFEIPAASSVESMSHIVETSHALSLPGLEGFLIPSGTRGHILKTVVGNIALVRWECMQSGIYILLLRLGQEFHLNSYEDVFVILDLLCRLVSFNMDLCFALMNVDKSLAVQTVEVSRRLENSLCVDAVKIICVMINKLAFSASSVGVMSMCINILCKMLKCSPSHVVTVASITNILDLGTSSPSSETWLLSGGLAKLLLVDCEQNEDNCSFTVSVIEFAMQLVGAGVDNDVVSSLVVFLLQFVLVNHEQWKYKLRHARWRVTLKVLELAKKCIKSVNDTSRPSWLVRDILLSDSSIHNMLFRIMCITTPALERLYVYRLYEMKEIEGLYLGVHSVLDIVYTILFNLSKDMHLGLSVFHQAVLSSKTKPIPVAKAVMSLLSFFTNPAIQVAAAKVLSILCIIAGKVQPYSQGNISFVSDEMQIKELNSSIQIILCDGTVINEDRSVGVLKLLTSAALYQPAFLLSIMSTKENAEVPLNNGRDEEPPLGSFRSNKASLLSSLLHYIGKLDVLITSHPYLLLNVLNFLKALWQGAAQYGQIVETVKNSDNFWGKLSSILPVSTSKKTFSFENLKDNEALCSAYAFQAQATVLEIMAHEIFMKGKSANLLDLEQILLSWFEGSVVEDLIRLYASCGHEKRILHRAKIRASQCIIHLIGKLYPGDTGSLSLSLLEKLHKVSKKLNEQPAFTELLSQYSSHGYSEGKDLNALIVSDLFYHLQGELDGREISPGPFRELSLYLLQLDIFRIKECKSDEDFSLGDNNAIVFDTKHLEEHLGLEYWGHSRWEASKEIAERMLMEMNDANNIVLKMVSRHSALKALCVILTVFFGNVIEAKPASLGGDIDGKLLESCIDHLCKNLLSTAESLITAPDLQEETLSFLSTQTELLLIITKVLNRQTTLKSGRPECVPICISIIKTLGSGLKVLTDVEPSTSGLKKTICVFLTLLLTSLQLSYPISNLQANQLVALDASSEVSLSSLSLLPILCNLLETDEYYNLSLSTIDTIVKGFLTPNSWLPIIQKHLNLQFIISKLYMKDSPTSTSVLLKFLLTLARTRGGARMLQNENLFTNLKGLFSLLFNERPPYSNQAENNLFVAVNNEEKAENLWGLGLAIVTAMIFSLGEESSCVDLVESVIPYFLVEKACMVSYYLSVPPFPTDDHSKKRARTQKAHISLTSLVEIEHTLMLVCTLAKHQQLWSKTSKEMDSELRERSIHLLAFLSRGGQKIGEGMHKTAPLFCPPVLKKEIELSGRPPFINSKHGWFALAALGCVAKTADSALSSSSFVVNITKDRIHERAHLVSRTYFSDLIATQMYRIAFLLLKFLCHQAKVATKRAEEVGFIDLAHFPELPMPEILHGIQDQAIAIVTELCRGDKSKVVQTEIQSICFLLLQIIEKALYLELCVSQSCGIRPVLGRVEDFSNEIKTLLQVAEQHPFLKVSLKSLKQIMTLVYPDLLQEGIL